MPESSSVRNTVFARREKTNSSPSVNPPLVPVVQNKQKKSLEIRLEGFSFSNETKSYDCQKPIKFLSKKYDTSFSILRSGYFYLDSYHEEHPRVFATNIRYRIMSLAWMETYGVS